MPGSDGYRSFGVLARDECFKTTIMHYPPRLQDTLDFFNTLTDQADRVNVLLELAEKFTEVPRDIASRPFSLQHRVPQCESEAYVWTRKQTDGTLKYYFAVENPSGVSAKALAKILDDTLSGELPETIAGVSEDIVYTIFRRDISMGKGLGLMSMVQAVAALAKQELASMKATQLP
jgi:cysteine desulfuration protein SufE